jgi:trehalose monomycolate/heme transporter
VFAWWGRTVYRYRFIVIGVMVALCLAGGLFGLSLGKHVTQSGFYDDGSQSAKASVLGDQVYGRDRTSHIVAIFTAPGGKTVEDPQWQKTITDELNKVQSDHPDQILGWVGWLKAPTTTDATVQKMHTSDMTRTFVSIPLKGNNDDEILNNYKLVQSDLQKLDGGNVELAGLQPVASELTGTIAKDQTRMEVLALPLVAVVLFFVFGGVIAAGLPVMIGGLAIASSLGILRLIAVFGPVHYFAQPVVTMIGLGIAIDYGLFVVSRFREEIADDYDTESAVRRTVMTAGRTVAFSAVIIVASAASLLMFPQGFLKSLTYAVLASVMLSAILSITVLPACLGVLGRQVDALGVRTLMRVPVIGKLRIVGWLADRLQKTKTREEIERGFWGKLVNRVMKRPVLFAAPIIIALILLIIPLGKLSLGGISEKYLPPDNPVRQAQEDFDRTFPGFRTQQLTLVIQNASAAQVDEIANKAGQISGFTNPTWQPRPANDEGNHDPTVTVLQNGLVNYNDAAPKITDLRSIQPPKGVTLWIGGTPALEQDSIHSIFRYMPLMLVLLLSTTIILMFLAFGSVVLPIKAAVMTLLTMCSTLGVLTWIFVDGHFSKLLNFTPTPLTAPVIGLIIALIYGLSTDYEVFLVSRMVEARERGMSTAEAIRLGTAATGRIITAAALILMVVGGAFVFSDLVMMKYLAFGLVAALLLDATVVRMFLVPSVMKLLGDDCWWAPRWMKRIQNRVGLGEIHLPDERKRHAPREPALASAGGSVPPPRPGPPHDPTHPGGERATRFVGQERSDLGTTRIPTRPNARPPAPEPPAAAGTTRMPTAHAARATEPPTTRLPTAAANPTTRGVSNATANTQRTYRPAPAPARDDREIESWLGELRGGGPAGAHGQAPGTQAPGTQGPAGGQRAGGADRATNSERTTAIPVHRPADPMPVGSPADDATTAIPIRRSAEGDRTEKLQAQKPAKKRQAEQRQRREGGTISAQDVLRREGRL